MQSEDNVDTEKYTAEGVELKFPLTSMGWNEDFPG